MDLKNDNEFIQTLLNDIRNKVKDTLITINSELSSEDDEDNNNFKENENHVQIYEKALNEPFLANNNIENDVTISKNINLKNNSNDQLTLIRHKF